MLGFQTRRIMRFVFADISDARIISEPVARICSDVECVSSLCGHIGSGHKSKERIFQTLNFMLNMYGLG